MTGVSNKTMLEMPCAEAIIEMNSGKIIKCNKDFLSLIGLDPNERLKQDLYSHDYLDKSERIDLKKALMVQKNEEERRGLCYLHRIKRADGSYSV